MKAVILAGGYGTRLAEETVNIPKPMVEIGGKPILWHIMKLYAHHGVTEFIVCLGYKGNVIKDYFGNYFLHTSDVTLDLSTGAMQVHQNAAEPWKVTLVDTGPDTQTGGRLKAVAHHLGDDSFCFTYGDGVGDIDVSAQIAFHKAHGKLATVTSITPSGRFGVLDLEGEQVTGFDEKAHTQGSINGGFFVLEPGVVDYIDGPLVAWERAPLERLAADGELMAWRHDGFWQPMDTLREKRALEALWRDGAAPWKVWEG